MILVRRLIDDAQYSYIANQYPGLAIEDYLLRQLRIWIDNNYDQFVVDLNSIFDLHVAIKENVPKSLKECIQIETGNNKIAKILSMPCVSLQTPDYEPDQTGSTVLWYDMIDLGNQRAERSLMRILDTYMKIGSNPYAIYEEEYKREAKEAKKIAGTRASKSPAKKARPKAKSNASTKKKTKRNSKKKNTKARKKKRTSK